MNPGSDEAVAAGCLCPIIDNAYGRGHSNWVDDKGGPVFVYNDDCPLHGEKSF